MSLASARAASMHRSREIRKDVLGENPPRRRVEEIPPLGVEPVAGLFEPIDGGEDTRQMFRVDRDHETGTRKASAKMRAQALGAISTRNDRRETIMGEGSGATTLAKPQRRAYRLVPRAPMRSSGLASERSSGAVSVSSPRS